MSCTSPLTVLSLVMAQVYQFPTSIPSPLPISLRIYFFFSNVLHVPIMSKNLISILAFYADNPINVLFFNSFFQVQDRHTGVSLVRGQLRDNVYYWPKFVPLQSSALALSFSVRSSVSTISMWHSCLGHLSLPIFL